MQATLNRVAIAALLLACAAASACSTPVCRYALENWPPDPYEAVVLNPGPLKPDAQKLFDAFKKTVEGSPANFALRFGDTKDQNDDAAAIWKEQENPQAPWMVISYCRPDGSRAKFYSGRFDEASISGLLDSPMRREITKRIMNGHSAVWVLLECGDKKKDDDAAKLLTDELKKAEEELKPEGEVEAGAQVWIPKFSTVRLPRTDAAEFRTVELFSFVEKTLPRDEPVVFPVIGRGRVLDGLSGKWLSGETIAGVAAFVFGPCSCDIKGAMPGHDLLTSAEWKAPEDGHEHDAGTTPAPEPAKPDPAAHARVHEAIQKHVEPNTVVKTPEPPAPSAAPKAAPAASRSGSSGPGMLPTLLLGIAIGIALALLFSRGAMKRNPLFGIVAGSAVVVAAMVALLMWDSNPAPAATEAAREPLLIYCAAAIKAPVEAAAKAYEKEHGVSVQLQFGSSESLHATLKLSQRGDLYIPADESYLATVRAENLVEETIPLAQLTPVIGVRKGNAKQIKSTKDFVREDVKFAVAGEGAAIGKLVKSILTASGEWSGLQAKLRGTSGAAVEVGTVTEVANSIKLGSVDAGVIWDATVAQYPDLEAVRQENLDAGSVNVALGVLKSSARPGDALRFARYLAAADKGLLEFKQRGYKAAEGDAWSEQPELKLFCGAMMRPAVEQTIMDFERREGARVTRVYNGCGILVAQMNTGDMPDCYFACDATFMSAVQMKFQAATTVSSNDLVIVVKQGNPFGVKSLKDLAEKPVKLGVGHERQCALGALTKARLESVGLCEAIMKNVKVQSPTGDFLVNQLRVGALDAVIAYASNATGFNDIEAVRLDDLQFAIQPIAVARESKQRRLAERLQAAILSAQSAERFQNAGFKWNAVPPKAR